MSNYNRFSVSIGSYDWAHPDRKQVAVRFFLRSDAPVGLKTSFTTHDITSKYDLPELENALAAAKYVLDYCKSCLYNGDLGDAQALYNYLDGDYRPGVSMETMDWYDQLTEEHAKLTARLQHLDRLLASLRKDMENPE